MTIGTRENQVFEPFILRALAAGIGVAMIAGPIGCFVVWRRMAYFGDSLAHSALLGIALGLATGMSMNVGIVLVCLSFALLFFWLQQQGTLHVDTLLGILAHAALSIGIVAMSLLNQRVDLHLYLFGDILTVMATEVWGIVVVGALVLVLLAWHWSSLVLMSIDEELALAEKVPTKFLHLLLVVLMTIVVAVSIRVVGILLITSLLIIPAATARGLVRSPEVMALVATLLGMSAVVGGISLSVILDTPSSPSIVASATVLFFLLFPISKLLSSFTPSKLDRSLPR